MERGISGFTTRGKMLRSRLIRFTLKQVWWVAGGSGRRRKLRTATSSDSRLKNVLLLASPQSGPPSGITHPITAQHFLPTPPTCPTFSSSLPLPVLLGVSHLAPPHPASTPSTVTSSLHPTAETGHVCGKERGKGEFGDFRSHF